MPFAPFNTYVARDAERVFQFRQTQREKNNETRNPAEYNH